MLLVGNLLHSHGRARLIFSVLLQGYVSPGRTWHLYSDEIPCVRSKDWQQPASCSVIWNRLPSYWNKSPVLLPPEPRMHEFSVIWSLFYCLRDTKPFSLLIYDWRSTACPLRICRKETYTSLCSITMNLEGCHKIKWKKKCYRHHCLLSNIFLCWLVFWVWNRQSSMKAIYSSHLTYLSTL